MPVGKWLTGFGVAVSAPRAPRRDARFGPKRAKLRKMKKRGLLDEEEEMYRKLEPMGRRNGPDGSLKPNEGPRPVSGKRVFVELVPYVARGAKLRSRGGNNRGGFARRGRGPRARCVLGPRVLSVYAEDFPRPGRARGGHETTAASRRPGRGPRTSRSRNSSIQYRRASATGRRRSRGWSGCPRRGRKNSMPAPAAGERPPGGRRSPRGGACGAAAPGTWSAAVKVDSTGLPVVGRCAGGAGPGPGAAARLVVAHRLCRARRRHRLK